MVYNSSKTIVTILCNIHKSGTCARLCTKIFSSLILWFSRTTVTPLPVTPLPVTPLPVTPLPVTPLPVTPLPVAPLPVTPLPVTPLPVTPLPVTPLPVTPLPVTPLPVTPLPVTPLPALHHNQWSIHIYVLFSWLFCLRCRCNATWKYIYIVPRSGTPQVESD